MTDLEDMSVDLNASDTYLSNAKMTITIADENGVRVSKIYIIFLPCYLIKQNDVIFKIYFGIILVGDRKHGQFP